MLEKTIKDLKRYINYPKPLCDTALDAILCLEDFKKHLKAQEPETAEVKWQERHRKSYRQYTGFDSMGEEHTVTVCEEIEGQERILAYMERTGSITQREALDELSVARLASRIDELRKAGHPIITERVDGVNKFGEPTRWARYRMGARA